MGKLYAIAPFTLLDYPGEVACIAWFSGCNLRCIYCHNPNIVFGRGEEEESRLIDLLTRRRRLLTAVVFSGGEATLYPALPELIKKSKGLGYKIKLDTNGTRPKVLQKLLESTLLDYVALDYKCMAPHTKELLGTARYIKAFNDSLTLLIDRARHGLKLDIRTTYHADLMTEHELALIIEDLDRREYRGSYTIQNISSYGENTLGNIAKPSRQLIREKLPIPRHFDLSFRNFPDADCKAGPGRYLEDSVIWFCQSQRLLRGS